MPPKNKFSKEQIIDAAFEIAKTEGIDQITIRKVAAKLGSSIAPIYVNFTDVEELKKEILKKISQLSQQMLMTSYSDDLFLNIGIASIKFAREYPVLFRELIMNNTRYVEEVQPDLGGLIAQMKQSPDLDGFTNEEMMEVMFKMQVFQLGLSVMDVNGMLPIGFSEEKLIEVLAGTGKDMIAVMRLRKNITS